MNNTSLLSAANIPAATTSVVFEKKGTSLPKIPQHLLPKSDSHVTPRAFTERVSGKEAQKFTFSNRRKIHMPTSTAASVIQTTSANTITSPKIKPTPPTKPKVETHLTHFSPRHAPTIKYMPSPVAASFQPIALTSRQERISSLKEMLVKDPLNPRTLIAAANLQRRIGNLNGALERLTRAFNRLDESDPLHAAVAQQILAITSRNRAKK